MDMTPGIRKFALTAHVSSSVSLLGSIAAFLVLAISGLNNSDAQVIRTAYIGMDLLAKFVVVPLALASLATGLIQSLGTSWGLFRHYWIVAKLLLTAFATTILLIKLKLIGYAAGLASAAILPRAELRAVGMELVIHAVGGLLVLLIPTALSIYKPWGLTPFGLRKQQEQRIPPQQSLPSQQRASGMVGISSEGAITITLRRMQILGFATVVLVLHILILHITNAGLMEH